MVVYKILQDYENDCSFLFLSDNEEIIKTKIPSYKKGTVLTLGVDNLYHPITDNEVIKSFDDFFSECPDMALKKIDLLLIAAIHYGYYIGTIFFKRPYSLLAIKNFDQTDILNITDVLKNTSVPTFFDRREELKNCIIYILQNKKDITGSTCFSLYEIYESVKKLLNSCDKKITFDEYTAIINYYSADFMLINEDICLFSDYNIEKTIIDFIYNKNDMPSPFLLSVMDEEISDFYSEKQKIAIKTLIPHKGCLSILTGGPGCGKTTTLKEIVNVFQRNYPNEPVTMLAPTGKAAKRMKEIMGDMDVTIATINKFLGFKKTASGYKPTHNPQELAIIRSSHFIIIDEASMLGVSLFATLLRFLDLDRTKIILVGDSEQLPSIEAGYLLNDLINLGAYTVSLDTNFRSDGTIVHNAYLIRNGESNFIEDDNFVITTDPLDINEILSSESSVVLSPFRTISKENSTDNLNNMMHEEKFKNFDPVSSKFRSGDKIIITKTHYNNGIPVYINGDTGTVISTQLINGRDEYGFSMPSYYIYEVSFYDYTAFVLEEDLDFGYAITIHKSQGSEYNTVHIIISEYEKFITRKMLYTAVTRAKNKVIIHSLKEIIEQIINNNKDSKRCTILQHQSSL